MFQGYDKIIIDSEEDLSKIITFSKENKHLKLGKDWHIPISKAVIVMKIKNVGSTYYRFNGSNDFIDLLICSKEDGNDIKKVTETKVRTSDGNLSFEKMSELELEMVKNVISLIMDTLFYIANINKNKVYKVETKEIKKKRENSNKKNKKKGNSITYITSNKYYISEKTALKTNKRDYVQRVFKWTVRGIGDIIKAV